VAEGTIVRCITRLDETCREVRDAARVIGDTELFKKMEEAQIKIKRDSELPVTGFRKDMHANLFATASCVCRLTLLLTIFLLRSWAAVEPVHQSHSMRQEAKFLGGYTILY
jgi:hypothetical protein